ncbi:GNAT family N-acetyltransferase [Mesorhizobium erdmanii]|nr:MULTISPECIES: GNAT family N-acetyltransferase [Mesorhizobium]OBQ74522.1 hypothetical protein A8146_01815 [Mesorhizobium loti]
MEQSRALVLRPGLVGDTDAIAEIDMAELRAEKLGPGKLAGFIRNENVIVAEVGGEIAGFCVLLYRPERLMAVLEAIAVLVNFARQGVGRTLLEAAEREATNRGYRSLQLHVRADNKRAIDIYRRSGFRRLWRIRRKPEIYLDEIVAIRMRKRLRPSDKQLTDTLSAFMRLLRLRS